MKTQSQYQFQDHENAWYFNIDTFSAVDNFNLLQKIKVEMATLHEYYICNTSFPTVYDFD